MIPTIVWSPDVERPTIRILDQTRLPREEVFLDLDTIPALCEAILALRVRGAPAIGIAGAYGIALAARVAAEDLAGAGAAELLPRIEADAARLRAVRPTAVNLAWAIDRVLARVRASAGDLAAIALTEARAIHDEDLAMSRAMGEHGAALLPQGACVLTHCNTGGLATGGLGTALAVVFTAHGEGKAPRVFVDETRPLLQGARLTMWELARAGVPATLIVDGAAAWAMKRHRVDAVLVGADRIAANGDAANKIGTYGLAIAAARHGVPFYVVAPSSTFDPALPSGDAIPIEERPAEEVTALELGAVGGTAPGVAGAMCGAAFGGGAASPSATAWNPAFDVTPAQLITGWVTEQGVRRRGDFT